MFWKERSAFYSERGLCYMGICICQNSTTDFQDVCLSSYVNFMSKTANAKLFWGIGLMSKCKMDRWVDVGKTRVMKCQRQMPAVTAYGCLLHILSTLLCV